MNISANILLGTPYNEGFCYSESEKQLFVKSEFERFIQLLDTYGFEYEDLNIDFSNGVSCYVTVLVDGYSPIRYRMSDHSKGAKWGSLLRDLVDVDSEVSYLGWLSEKKGFYEYSYFKGFDAVDIIESELNNILKKYTGSKILCSYLSKRGNEIVKIERSIWAKGYLNTNEQ